MTTFILKSDDGRTREFDTKAEAEQEKAEIERLGANIELISDSGSVIEASEANDSEAINDDDLDADEDIAEAVNTANEIAHDTVENTDVPNSPDVTEDPLAWMPSHFIDQIEGVPAINRKGYAVLAEHYDISTCAEAITYPSESDFEYAEFRAVATTPEGREYSGFGSAHIERGDDKTLLGELAETRAIKRATSNATGVGMVAVSEMQGSVEGRE